MLALVAVQVERLVSFYYWYLHDRNGLVSAMFLRASPAQRQAFWVFAAPPLPPPPFPPNVPAARVPSLVFFSEAAHLPPPSPPCT